MPKQSPTVDRVFHALACPARRVIVERLTRGAASVTQLAEPLGMALPSVMQHLGVLEECGLVRSEKTGRVRTCRIDPAALAKAEDWFSRQRAVWERRLDRLDDYLTDLQKKEKDRGDSN
jgi:DNA-binding transcriptional ArsR family regulator